MDSGGPVERATPARPIDVAWAVAAVAIPVLVAIRSKLITVDLAYHLRLGDQILSTGSIPRTDTFTFTMAGTPWVDQQWGAQIALELVYRLGGWTGLVVFRAALIGASFALVLLACRARGTSLRMASALTVAAFVMSGSSLALRPQLLAFPLVCLTLWIVVTYEGGCRRLLALPLIGWVCATVHGAFVVVVLLVLVAAISAWITRSPVRTLVTAAAASTVVMTFLTPLGLDLWTSALGSAGDPVLREFVTEWQRTTLATPEGWMLLVSGAALVVLIVRRRTLWHHAIWLAPFLALAINTRRGLLWWAVVTPVVAAAFLATDRQSVTPNDGPVERESWAPAGILIGLLGLIAVALVPFGATPDQVLLGAPTGLAPAIERTLDQESHVLAYQPWASWLEFAAPDTLQFVDSRFLLTDQILADYLTVDAGDTSWREVADRWRVDAIAGPTDWPVFHDLRADDNWSVVYDDAGSVLAVRVAEHDAP